MPNDQQQEIVRELYRRRATLSPEQGAIVDELAKRFNITDQPAAVDTSLFRQVADFGQHAIIDPVVGAYDAVKRIATPPTTTRDKIASGIAGPAGPLVADMLGANVQAARNAYNAVKQGNYGEALRQGVAAVPVIGPAVSQFGTEIANGQYGAAAGDAFAMLAPVHTLIPSTAKAAVLPKVTNPNPVTRAAVDFARRNDIPVSAKVATGNKVIGGIQHAADYTPIGSFIADSAKAAEDAALTRVGGELASRIHETPVDTVQAGASNRAAVEEVISARHQDADAAYSRLRELETDPANVEKVQVGTKTTTNANGQKITEPVYEDMALPVDIRAVKKQLKPVYNQITRNMAITKRRMSDGLLAIENIMNARDFEPASIVDQDLSVIKAAARGADLPELKTLSQGLAAHAVGALETEVTKAIGKARTFDNSAEAAAAAAATPEASPTPRPAAAQPAAIVGKATPSTGAETIVKVPDGQGTQYKAKYEVRELDEVQPSHNGHTFEPNTRYELKNERQYNKGENQEKVVVNSTEEKFDPSYHVTDNPDALNGPIVIDSNGNALGGNGRAMILQRVYAAGKDAAAKYRGLLESRLERFGIDPQTVAGMRQPVLVRVLDDAELAKPGAKAKAIADFNVKGTAELTPAEQAIRDSRRVSPATLEHIAERIQTTGPDATLLQTIEGQGGLDLLQRLIDDGVINGTTERAALAGKEGLTKAGKDRISSLMLGRYFSDPAQLDTIAPAVRAKVERIAAPLATVEGSAAWNLSPHMQGALDLLEQARTAGAAKLDDYLKQGGLLIEQEHSPQAIALAKQLTDANPTEITAAVRKYAEEMHYADQYEGPGLFGDLPDPKTPREAFNEAFGAEIGEAAFEKPVEKAKPKFANFDEADIPQAPPPRPTKPRGAEALEHLEQGRAATRAKYDAAAVLKDMREEPAQTFGQAIYAKDAGITHLNELARIAPGEMPKIGRALVDDLLATATKEGGFTKAQSVYNKWEALGPKTKRILFNNPQLVEDLDNFFTLAKKSAENPNPSGTATLKITVGGVAAIIVHPATGIPLAIAGGVLAKLLRNHAFIEALENGVKVPVGKGAASTIAATRLLRIAGDAAKPLAALPKAARRQPTETPTEAATAR